jgi:SAM-dependent methyltransferase
MAEASTSADLYGLAVSPARGARTTDPCPVCRGIEADAAFSVEGLSQPVVVCRGCGLGRFHPALDAAQVAAFYPEEYYGEPNLKFASPVEALLRRVGARHISFLTGDLPRGARVLDVGCGRGVILGPLADLGFEAHGVEISEHAVRGVDPRAHVCIADRLEGAAYEAGRFDRVVIWHVLEHLAEPRATLEEIHRILKPGGRLIVSVPNFSSFQAKLAGPAWFHLDLPRHLFQFPLPALLQLLDDTGFETESTHHFSLRQNPFGWIQSALNALPGLPRNGLYALMHRRPASEKAPFGLAMRLWMLLLAGLIAPFAVLASVAETLLRNAATIHVVARRRDDAGAALSARRV